MLAFMPHGHCFFWKNQLLALHVASDVLIALAYFSIPVLLYRLTRGRDDLPFSQLFGLFAAFILACGATHVMGAWNMWHAHYWVEGWSKAVTAVVSLWTAIVLQLRYEEILKLPSPAALQAEIERRRQAEARLENLVETRTRELGLARREYQTHKMLLEELLVTLPSGVLKVDQQGKVVMSNPSARTMLGFEGERLPSDLAEQQLFTEDEVSKNLVVDGRELLCSVKKLDDQGAVAVFADITHQRVVERELRAANRELKLFAQMASHDLKEPLRGISGCMELLQDSLTLDERQTRLFELAVGSARRMSELLEGLRRYTLLGSDHADRQPVSLDDLAAAAVQDLNYQILKSEAEVEIEPLGRVLGDSTQLSQLLSNLLGNALKYCGDNPPRIHLGRQDGVFFVRDTGIGFDPEHSERIFEPLQRLHREEIAGTGLGLAMCRRIVERHGGRIWAISTPGEGATFYFTFEPTRFLEPLTDA